MTETEFKDRPELIKKRARAVFVTRLFWTSIILMVALCLGILVYNALQAAASRQRLMDCTTPGGKCYAEGQARTAEAVKSLITAGATDEIATRRTVVLAAACAAGIAQRGQPVTVESVEQCVNRELKEDEE
jgi:hypothetical protein